MTYKVVNKITGYEANTGIIEKLSSGDEEVRIPLMRQFWVLVHVCDLCGYPAVAGQEHSSCIAYEQWQADHAS